MLRARWAFAVVVLAQTLLRPPGAVAQPIDAEALFREAKIDVEGGRVAEACVKFQQSFELSGVAGALLNWADCEERRGRLLAASDLWSQGVAAVAKDAERSKYVAARIASLAERTPRLTLIVNGTARSIVLDQQAVAAGGVPLELDPGVHQLRIEWEGGKREEVSIRLREREVRELTLTSPHEVAEGPRRPVESTRTPEPGFDYGALKVPGWIVGGVGLGGAIAFAATAGIVASRCEERICPPELEGVLVGNALATGIGAAGLGAGAVLLGMGYGVGDAPAGAPRLGLRLAPRQAAGAIAWDW